jgi:hypothetical protein
MAVNTAFKYNTREELQSGKVVHQLHQVLRMDSERYLDLYETKGRAKRLVKVLSHILQDYVNSDYVTHRVIESESHGQLDVNSRTEMAAKLRMPIFEHGVTSSLEFLLFKSVISDETQVDKLLRESEHIQATLDFHNFPLFNLSSASLNGKLLAHIDDLDVSGIRSQPIYLHEGRGDDVSEELIFAYEAVLNAILGREDPLNGVVSFRDHVSSDDFSSRYPLEINYDAHGPDRYHPIGLAMEFNMFNPSLERTEKAASEFAAFIGYVKDNLTIIYPLVAMAHGLLTARSTYEEIVEAHNDYGVDKTDAKKVRKNTWFSALDDQVSEAIQDKIDSLPKLDTNLLVYAR